MRNEQDARGRARAERKFYEREEQRRRKKRIYGQQDIQWDGLRLRLCTGRLLATVEDDPEWVGMYRVRLPGGYLTDMVNLSRAKDAAIGLALGKLNSQETGVEAAGARYFREAAE